MRRVMIPILIAACLLAATVVLVEQAHAQVSKLADQNVVDCSDAAMQSAQRELRRQIEPFLYTTAEEYSGNPEVLAEKEVGRNKVLVQWIKMRCVCNKGMSDFEKTLCLAMKQNLKIGDNDSCLIRY